MKKITPSILAGFMELLPADQILFNQMLDTIRDVYERFGFLPIDTPVIEKAEILLAKAGGETEKQIYRFEKGKNELALRFDLTVPLARYVSQHFSSLSFPFRRYHIGKVYRGERPQKGRFREFYQCDVDVIGNGSLNLFYDAEMVSIIYFVFRELGFGNFVVRINNRKILSGFLENLRVQDLSTQILRVIDKLEKTGIENVKKELKQLGLNNDVVENIVKFISIKGNNEEILSQLMKLDIKSKLFVKGVQELSDLVAYIKDLGVPKKNFQIDLTIARGLDYYTGTVYETTLIDYLELGSVCSGGRYDNLAENYTDKKLPGVGVSIGLTRLFSKLREANIIKPERQSLTSVLIIPLEGGFKKSFAVARELRENRVNVEIYMEEAKLKKKFSYADKCGIPLVIVIGEEEVRNEYFSVKDMKNGKQFKVSSVEEMLAMFFN